MARKKRQRERGERGGEKEGYLLYCEHGFYNCFLNDQEKKEEKKKGKEKIPVLTNKGDAGSRVSGRPEFGVSDRKTGHKKGENTRRMKGEGEGFKEKAGRRTASRRLKKLLKKRIILLIFFFF